MGGLYKNNNLAGCRLGLDEDPLIWSESLQTRNISAKSAYQAIVQDSSPSAHKLWYKLIQKWKIPLKFKCFFMADITELFEDLG